MPRRTTRRRPMARVARAPLVRRQRPRRRRMAYKARISRPIASAFPAKRIVTLRYVQIKPLQRVLPDGTTSASSYYFSCNSAYDPDQTTAGAPGHQPYYFDQLAIFYTRYSVLSSKVTFAVGPTSSPFMLFARVERSYGASADPTFVDAFTQADLERPGVRSTMITPGIRNKPLSLKWTCKSATFTRDDNVGFTGNAGTGSDPAYQDYFRVGACTLLSGGTEGASGSTGFGANLPSMIATITYRILFTEPKTQPIS